MVAIGAPSAAAAQKIDPAVRARLSTQKESDVWVVMREKANLAPAYRMKNWEARGRFVAAQLQAAANRSQGRVRALLAGRGKGHEPFWIVNAIKLTADAATVDELAQLPEVERIVPDGAYQIPDPIPGVPQPPVNGVEWNIDRIRAPQVWAGFGVRGEGIVIANIDTGVQYDHPALVAQYRGNRGDGSFDHNYNWFDPAGMCGGAPCDNVDHGTHTMGTMVGDDGADNQIGVAPGARWIAAKGCEYNSCSFESLMASGQWILAPTDLSGQNPRADLRPHVVNNSWGGGGGDPFYQGIVDSWNASGIFPQFSIGNDGSSCNTSGSPGNYLNSYAAGAFDSGDTIAWFSSRGPSPFEGEIKPNIAAPGVDVRSSVPGNGYGYNSGTSMASPHVAGTVALMWSVAPALLGDIAATRALLDETAIDVADSSCDGGYPGVSAGEDNNVWGEGRLDAFAAVDRTPYGPVGSLAGIVTDSAGAPIGGATVAVSGPSFRTTLSGPDGSYALRLPTGDYTVDVSAFGYIAQTAAVTIAEGATTAQDFALEPAPAYPVTGTVLNEAGAPVANALVTILGTPIPPATTDAAGAYSFAGVPAGSYEVRATPGGCYGEQTQALTVVDGPVTLDFTLQGYQDAFGYSCAVEEPAYIEGDTPFPLSGDDGAEMLSLPFPFTFYGQTYETAYVSTNGFINFLWPDASLGNGPIPSYDWPNAAIYAFWDDLVVADSPGIFTRLIDDGAGRRFVIEWRDVRFCCVSEELLDVEIVLYENGTILTQYRDVDANGRERGDSATLGIENESGSVGLQFSYDQAVIGTPAFAVRYSPPPSGYVQGYVTDANDGGPLGWATVRALQDGAVVREAYANERGFYRLVLPVGDYVVEASSGFYEPATASASVGDGGLIVRDFTLRAAQARLSPRQIEFVIPAGEARTKTLTLRNTGSLDLSWQIWEGYWMAEAGEGEPPTTTDITWLGVSPTGGTLAPGATQSIQVTADSAGLGSSSYYAVLYLESNSGRDPYQSTYVSLIVPDYYQAVNAGGAAYIDGAGDSWAADRKFSAGGWGYTNAAARANSTRKPIAGTDEDLLFQAQRENPTEYRFDGVPNGSYRVELLFADLTARRAGQRIFDVFIEGSATLPAHDIAGEVGALTADSHSFSVLVSDGQLNIRLAPIGRGYQPPVINAIRVFRYPGW